MISFNIGATNHTGLQLNHSKEILTILLYSGLVTRMIQNIFGKQQFLSEVMMRRVFSN